MTSDNDEKFSLFKKVIKKGLEHTDFIDDAKVYLKDAVSDIADNFKNSDKSDAKVDNVSGEVALKNSQKPLAGAPASLLTSVFLEPKNAESLHNVTKFSVPEIPANTSLISGVKWRIRGLGVKGSVDSKDNHYTVFLGRKNGFSITHDGETATTGLNLTYKPLSKKVEFGLSSSTATDIFSGGVYSKKDNIGGYLSYSNVSGAGASLSVDKKGISLGAGYTKDYNDGTHLELKAFVSRNKIDNYGKVNFVGVSGVLYINPIK